MPPHSSGGCLIIMAFFFNFGRSDCVFTIHVEQKGNGGSTENGIRSKISLIDMAGMKLEMYK